MNYYFKLYLCVVFAFGACAARGNRHVSEEIIESQSDDRAGRPEECSAKGGSTSGTCANGFGVCCIISLNCGQASSENCTYISQAAATTGLTSPCNYKICKCSADICRIRLDFTTFVIADPFVGTTTAGSDDDSGVIIGDCITDTFTYSSPGNAASPTICGINTGQHMILDASDSCNELNFKFATGVAATRQYEIKVTQYECGVNLGGEPDCLQYHTGSSGVIASFNFPLSTTTVDAGKTHLSNQCYSICFRRESGMCALCFMPRIKDPMAVNIDGKQSSFGLSLSPEADAPQANVGSLCDTDYLQIPGAQLVTSAIAVSKTGLANSNARICGRVFSASHKGTTALAYSATTPESICTVSRPFRIDFKTDANEVTTAITADGTKNEEHDSPGGIVGFLLDYSQLAC